MKNCKTYKYYVPFVLFLCLCGVFLIQLMVKGERLNAVDVIAPNTKVSIFVHETNDKGSKDEAVKIGGGMDEVLKEDSNSTISASTHLQAMNKSPRDFKESLEGEVSLLHFFATWCGPCMDEHDDLVTISQTSNIPLYGVAYKDDSADLKRLFDKEPNPYRRIYLDDEGSIGLDMGIYGTPTTFIMDKKGRARYRYTGKIHAQDFEKLFDRAIKELQNEQ